MRKIVPHDIKALGTVTDKTTPTQVNTTQRHVMEGEQIIAYDFDSDSVLFLDKATGFATKTVAVAGLTTGTDNVMALHPDGRLFFLNNQSGTSKLHTLDPITFDETFIANVTFPGTLTSADGVNALAFHPGTNVLYGLAVGTEGPNEAHLITVPLAGGAVTDVGSTAITEEGSGLAFDTDVDSPTLYAVIDNSSAGPSGLQKLDLYTVVISTGVAALVGDTLFDRSGGIDFDSAGVLYGVMTDPAGSFPLTLVTVNLSTGAAVDVEGGAGDSGQLFIESIISASSTLVNDLTIRRFGMKGSEFSPSLHRSDEIGTEYGAVNAYKVNVHPHPHQYPDGMRVTLIPGTTNTLTVTLQVNELPTRNVLNASGQGMTPRDLMSGCAYDLIYLTSLSAFKVLAAARYGNHDTVTVTVSEAAGFTAGQWVSLFDSSGFKVRLADATDGTKLVNGYVAQAFADAASALVFLDGENPFESGKTAGQIQYLSTTAGELTTTKPSTTGNAVQEVGISLSGSNVKMAVKAHTVVP